MVYGQVFGMTLDPTIADRVDWSLAVSPAAFQANAGAKFWEWFLVTRAKVATRTTSSPLWAGLRACPKALRHTFHRPGFRPGQGLVGALQPNYVACLLGYQSGPIIQGSRTLR